MNKRLHLLPVLAGLLALSACGGGDDDAAAPEAAPLFPQVKAVLGTHCMSCHSASGAWSGRPVALDTDADIVAHGASIKASVADPVSPSNRRMPQDGSLSAADIATIVAWVAKGGRTSD